MIQYPVNADPIYFLSHLVASLQPFADAHSVSLSFESEIKSLQLNYHPETVIADLIPLLCRIITFTPQKQKVKLSVLVSDSKDEIYLKLLISNTGVNLTHVREIVAHIHHPVIVHETEDNRSIFEMRWQVEASIEPIAEFTPHINHPPDNVRSFHAEVRKRMSLTLNKPQYRMALLESQKPKEAIFLQKTMAMIDVHLADESFDANQLARSLAISRMQLHRRLKPLIQQSPGHFIRDIRLAKAKDMIEKEDLTLGEISYKTGFQSQSHFTRTFIKKYGVRPSAYRKGK